MIAAPVRLRPLGSGFPSPLVLLRAVRPRGPRPEGSHDCTCPPDPPLTSSIRVVKRDGTVEPYDGYEIARSIEDAARGLDDAITRATQIQSELEITLFDQMTTEQLDEAVIQVALGNVKDDPAFDTIAARLLIKTLYKRVLGETHDLFGDGSPATIQALHREQFAGYVTAGVATGLLDTRLVELFDLDRLAAALDPARDDLLHYIGVQTLRTRYMITDQDRHPLEVPQFFWMRVAMGLSLNEEDPTTAALGFYDKMSRLEYLAAGSTLVNAGTSYAQLSNCFVMQMEDDIEHIAKSVRDVMWLTKGTGGIGLSVSQLRSEGSPIRSNNTTSTGPIPFMHTIDSTLRAISRGGKKFGALCFYMENWHLDFAQFLDLRQNSGDPYRRTRTANTAVWISDEFMKRVRDDQPWYLFDPLETPDLTELYGAAFSARYAEYVAMAEAGSIRRFTQARRPRAVPGHPDLAADHVASVADVEGHDQHPGAEQQHRHDPPVQPVHRGVPAAGPRQRRRLQPGLDQPVPAPRREPSGRPTIDWDRLRESARSAVRQLDNLIDITISSVPESEASNADNRAVGLGRDGVHRRRRAARAVVRERGGLRAGRRADGVHQLPRDRRQRRPGPRARRLPELRRVAAGPQGLVPFDTLDLLEADRGDPVRRRPDRPARLGHPAHQGRRRHPQRHPAGHRPDRVDRSGRRHHAGSGPAVQPDLQPGHLLGQVPRGQPQPGRRPQGARAVGDGP